MGVVPTEVFVVNVEFVALVEISVLVSVVAVGVKVPGLPDVLVSTVGAVGVACVVAVG